MANRCKVKKLFNNLERSPGVTVFWGAIPQWLLDSEVDIDGDFARGDSRVLAELRARGVLDLDNNIY